MAEWFVKNDKAESFDVFEPGNVLVSGEKSFENVAALLEESGFDVSGLTEFEFYCRVEHLETKAKKIEAYASK